jgi:hypothetical protein
MKNARIHFVLVAIVWSIAGAVSAQTAAKVDSLASWNDGPAKKAIVAFVDKVTTEGSADFVPVSERIATFDNDGTLWAEQPMYVQGFFAVDRIKALASQHPEWQKTEPYASVLREGLAALKNLDHKQLAELILVSHGGNTTEEFEQIVKDWLATARHPTTGKRFTEMIYEPMVELLQYLRAHDFKTYIVSGGGIEFMRPWTETAYGIPPEQVVGSSVKTKYALRDGKPVIERLVELNFIDDGPGKPVGIQQFIGRRPVFAFGNSDGDFEMLEWTTAGAGPRFGGIVHHTDATREWAYDRDSSVGRLKRALDEAPARGWIVVDMKDEWKHIYPDAQSDRSK